MTELGLRVVIEYIKINLKASFGINLRRETYWIISCNTFKDGKNIGESNGNTQAN